MSIYVCPPTPQTLAGFANEIDNAWKTVMSEPPRTGNDQLKNSSALNRIFPDLKTGDAYGRPWLVVEHGNHLPTGPSLEAVVPHSRGRASKPLQHRKNRAKKSCSEPPSTISIHRRDARRGDRGRTDVRDGTHDRAGQPNSNTQQGQSDCAEGFQESDWSDSSRSEHGGGGRSKRSRHRRSKKLSSSLTCAISEPSLHKNNRRAQVYDCNSPPGGRGPVRPKPGAGVHEMKSGVTASRGLMGSKSESCILAAKQKSDARLPKVNPSTTVRESTNESPRRRGRRDLRLPPPGGRHNTAGNALMKEMDAQIAGLRASPCARRALEARVCHHLSKRTKRYNHHGVGDRKAPEDLSVSSSTDSIGTPGFGATSESGGLADRRDDGNGCQQKCAGSLSLQRRNIGSGRGGWGLLGRLIPGKAMESTTVSERVAAQTLHTQEVQRRKRAIEDERSKLVMERSAFLEEEARRPRDRKAEKKKAEALITIVYCAVAFAEWKIRLVEKLDAIRQAKLEDSSAVTLQRAWRMSRVRRTLALVRASTPAVRCIVFRMRMKAAEAREAVAKRRRKRAADLIYAALRTGTRNMFRTRICYYRERIVKCQRLCSSYREVTKARKRALTNKWTRHVHKLDERRFSTYSAHLRDMYNFDPSEVEGFLKEMRRLAAQGQTAAQAMKAKPVQGLPATHAHDVADEMGGGDSEDSKAEEENDGRDGVRARADAGARVERPRASNETIPHGFPRPNQGTRDPPGTASSTTSISGSAPTRGRIKLVAGWQKRVAHVHSDVEAQASLMSRRGVKHKEISRALRNVLISDMLDCARREHRNWCWNHVRAIREKERQTAVVNMTDIKSVLRTDSGGSTEGLLEGKIEALTTKDVYARPFNGLQYMHLLTMITDDLVTRFIILAERIESCVAADGSGGGWLSPEELREIFVVNRHPNQHEAAAAKEAKTELQVWAKERGVTLPAFRRVSSSKAGAYRQQKAVREQQSEKNRQIPYFDFMDAVKGGILLDIRVPEKQRVAAGRSNPMSNPKRSQRHA